MNDELKDRFDAIDKHLDKQDQHHSEAVRTFNEHVLSDPALVGKRYRDVVKHYLAEMDDVVRTTAADYHRVTLKEKYDDVLARFLLGRLQKKGRR